MSRLKNLQFSAKEMLDSLSRTDAHIYFTRFPNKKIELKERTFLREALINQIKSRQAIGERSENFNWGHLLKIGQKPECPFASISIAHCPFIGGFLFVFDTSLSIGFDIEQKKRITKKLIGRISSTEEIQTAPSPALLWAAKEAGFKCLYERQTQLLLSACRISHWRKDPEKQIYFFNCHSKKTGKKAVGAGRAIENLVMAYAETTAKKA